MKTTLKRMNQISHLALAIKTVPNLAFHDYEPHVQEIINRQLFQGRTKNPGLTYEQFASQDPDYARVICISLGYIAENADGEQLMRVKSFTGEETEILTDFSRVIARYSNTFVHERGRSYDIPILLSRMCQLKVNCPNCNFVTELGSNGYPHLDLSEYQTGLGNGGRLPLSIITSLSRVPTSSYGLEGPKLFEAFRNGEERRIARDCEWNVTTVLNLLRLIVEDYPPIPTDRYYSVDVDGECGLLAEANANGRCPSAWLEHAKLFASSEVIHRV